MSIKKVSKEQPDDFEFNLKNLDAANEIILKYPEKKTTKCSNAITLSGTSSMITGYP